MKYAIIDNFRQEAVKGLNGICPICGEPVIAKCGKYKVNHWAHKVKKCDLWKENETEWHRKWKNCYTEMYQEIVFTDDNYYEPEKHIADIYTKAEYVIEFQHSYIGDEERTSRENYYTKNNKNMLWVVDGTRLKTDYKRLLNSYSIHHSKVNGLYYTSSPQNVFPSIWLNSNVPVIFDFLGLENESTAEKQKIPLYCLLHRKVDDLTIFITISRQKFIYYTIEGGLFYNIALKKSEFVQGYLTDRLKKEKNYYTSLKFNQFDTVYF